MQQPPEDEQLFLQRNTYAALQDIKALLREIRENQNKQADVTHIQLLHTKMSAILLSGVLEELRLLVGSEVTAHGASVRKSINQRHEQLRRACEQAEAALRQHLLSLVQQSETSDGHAVGETEHPGQRSGQRETPSDT